MFFCRIVAARGLFALGALWFAILFGCHEAIASVFCCTGIVFPACSGQCFLSKLDAWFGFGMIAWLGQVFDLLGDDMCFDVSTSPPRGNHG